MNIVGQWFSRLTYVNGIIALAAVAQCALTYLIVGLPVRPYILIIEGTSTLLLYNFSLFLAKPANPQISPYPRTRFFFRHERAMWGISIVAVLILLYAISQIHIATLFFLGGIGILSLLYNLPIFYQGKRKVGLRQFPRLKLFYIATLWSLSTVGLPVVEAWSEQSPFEWQKANFLGIMKVLFLIICTLPFDIRDIKQDMLYGLKTIPVIIGKTKSIRLTYILLIVHSVLALFAPYSFSIKVGLILTNIWVLFILNWVFRNTNSYNTSVYLLDVTLILQYIITVVVSWLVLNF